MNDEARWRQITSSITTGRFSNRHERSWGMGMGQGKWGRCNQMEWGKYCADRAYLTYNTVGGRVMITIWRWRLVSHQKVASAVDLIVSNAIHMQLRLDYWTAQRLTSSPSNGRSTSSLNSCSIFSNNLRRAAIYVFLAASPTTTQQAPEISS